MIVQVNKLQSKLSFVMRLLICATCALSISSRLHAEGLTKSSSTWDNLLKSVPTYPACSNRDDFWIQQSGRDSVNPTPIQESQAMVLNAEQMIGMESNVHYARGNVQAYKGDNTIVADWLSYDQKQSHATGGGNVVLSRGSDVIRGNWIDLERGTLTNVSILQNDTDFYIEGSPIRIFNKDQFSVESGSLTSCDPRHPEWQIRARSVDVDYQDSTGVARGMTFYVESVPIIKIPYMTFPLGKRKSGFLYPEFGYNNGTNANVGAFLSTPYYWNMAPNYDMTITPRAYSNAGFILANEFRYLNKNGKGSMYTEQMPNSYGGSQNGYRYYYRLQDNHTLVKDVNVGYHFNRVSDNNYFNDFGNFYSIVDNMNLEQSAYTTYRPQWGLLGVKVQGYQTIQPTATDVAPTVQIYSALPQVNFNVNPIVIANSPVKVNLISQYSNFAPGGITPTSSAALQAGQRAVIYPSLTMPYENMWSFVKPKVGLSYTNYQLSPFAGAQSNASAVNRSLPISAIDSGLIFERSTTWFGSNYSQTLEPRLYYLYIPSVNQNNIPIFDTATASYNINQLFSENRFAGFDRINAANDLTGGISSKFISDKTGVELANWGVGYRYYLTGSNNLLYGQYNQFRQLYQPQPNLIAELNNRWARSLTTNAMFQYDAINSTVDLYALQLRYNPGDFKVINARFSYQYNMPVLYAAYNPLGNQNSAALGYQNQYAIDVSGQWPLFFERWFIEGRLNYDFTSQQLLNGLGGIEYNGGCWSVRALYGHYVVNAVNIMNPIYLQFQLKGLGGIGTDPTNDLKVNVPGYMPIMNQPGFAPMTTVR
jgi:LPS-assembly protein